MTSTSLIWMARNCFEAQNIQIPGKVCAPQKWPPVRTIEMLPNVVGSGPKSSIG